MTNGLDFPLDPPGEFSRTLHPGYLFSLVLQGSLHLIALSALLPVREIASQLTHAYRRDHGPDFYGESVRGERLRFVNHG